MRSLETGEVMHPGVGPREEAERLYVRQSRLAERLREPGRDKLVLFDVGLGAGSNALAARAESERAPELAACLELVSFERDLGALELALAHAGSFGFDEESCEAARAILSCGEHRTARTHWVLRSGELLTSLAEESLRAEIVFWDPFSPRANPSLWTVAAFSALRRAVGDRCTLFTYSASTATRVALLLADFAVGVGDPIGERSQTTAAALSLEDLARPLESAWPKRLLLPDAPMPSDAPPDAVARVAAKAQFVAPR